MKTRARPSSELRKENCESHLHLAAFEDEQLSAEAAKQLVALKEDPERPVHSGEDLLEVNRADLPAPAKQED